MSLGTSRVSNTFMRARVPFFTRLSSVSVLKQRKRRLLSLILKFHVSLVCLACLLLPFYSRYSNMNLNKKLFYTVFGQCHLISTSSVPVILLFAYQNVAMILTNPFFKAILVGKNFQMPCLCDFEKLRDFLLKFLLSGHKLHRNTDFSCSLQIKGSGAVDCSLFVSNLSETRERQVQILLDKWIGSSVPGSALITSCKPYQLMPARHASAAPHGQIHKLGDPKRIY